MNILTVCTGNVFRSRLAEAYLKSKLSDKNINVTSAGTHAAVMTFGNIAWYARICLEEENLVQFASTTINQLTKEKCDEADLILCMEEVHKNFISDNFHINSEKCMVLNISDLSTTQIAEEKINMESTEKEIIAKAHEIYSKIKENINLILPDIIEKSK